MLNKHNRELRQAAIEMVRFKRQELEEKDGQTKESPIAENAGEPSSENPMSKHEANLLEVKRLQKEGTSIHSMARQTGLHRQTIKKYMHYTDYPRPAFSSRKASRALPYEPYLRKRWEAGERNVKQLWREIVGQGFKGSFSSVYRLTCKFTDGKEKQKRPTPLEVHIWSARKVSFLLTMLKDKLDEEEAVFLKAFYKVCPKAKRAATLGKAFKFLSDKRQGKHLDALLDKAKSSGIAALKNFAVSLVQDYDAVKAGLTLDWSNGQVEGQVNRLKNLKRQMYGRASFSLLRKRVLFDSG